MTSYYLIFLLLIIQITPAQAFGNKILTAAQAFQVQAEQDGGTVHVHARIADPCYLYQDRFTVQSSSISLQAGSPTFISKAELKDDPEFGKVAIFHRQMELTVPVRGKGMMKLSWQGCNERVGICYPPQSMNFHVTATTTQVYTAHPNAPSLLTGSLLLGFYLGGLAIAFTPCIWPMVPILSGLIARQPGRNQWQRTMLSFSYILGSACSYGIFGAIFAGFGHSVAISAWFQQPIWIIAMSLVFVALALSLFGVYSLHLPAAVNNQLDAWSRKQRLGSLVGSFIMGILAAFIVSPCVSAPMAAALIYVSQAGSVPLGFLCLFILGLGIGSPLIVFAVFQAHFLPKSGQWMQGVQNALGVLLLATAIYLLSRILAPQWIYGLYGVLLLGSGVVLGGLEAAAYGWPRIQKTIGITAILSGGFVMLHAWNLWLAVPEPVTRNINTFSPQVVHTPAELQFAILHFQGQPILLDYWARWCISCQEIESHVLHQPEVQHLLSHTVVIQVDVTQANPDTDALLRQFQLPGPPALILLDAHGQVLRPWLNGDVSVSNLIQYLNRIPSAM